MTKQYDLTFDLITEMSGNYGRDSVVRVQARETAKFYFAKMNGGELRYPKLDHTCSDGCVSGRTEKGMSTSETRLYIIDSEKAKKIRHDSRMRIAVQKIKERLDDIHKTDNSDPRILQVAELLGFKIQ